MSVSVRVTKSFKTAVKPLLKKYPSLKNDLLLLEKELLKNPREGTPLGHGAYKIRLKISSKGRGKNGITNCDLKLAYSFSLRNIKSFGNL